MIQDIEPYKYRVEYENLIPQDNDRVILMGKGALLVKGDVMEYPFWEQVKEYKDIKARYLFAIEEQDGNRSNFFYVYDGESAKAAEKLLSEGYEFIRQRDVMYRQPKWKAFAGVTAYQFASWYQQNQYCGRCGGKMVHDYKERMVCCPDCKEPVYPRINPVVIVGVTNGEKILLTKYAGGEYRRYALVAGFAEAGESIEDTVRREVYEETGIRVKNIRFYKSQPWSLSNSLLMGFYCDLDGSPEVALNDGELSVAEWVQREDIPDIDEGIALTAEMMLYFRDGGII